MFNLWSFSPTVVAARVVLSQVMNTSSSFTSAFAYASLALLIPAFVYSLTITLLTMVPEYQCLELVGGDGCDDGAGGGGS